MAYSKPTLETLKQSLADRHDSGDLPTEAAILAQWIRLLNRGVAYCIDRLKLTKKTSLTTSSGTIALPDDFISIDKVLDSSKNEYAQIDLDESDASSSGNQVYWISGDFDDGFYLNSPDDETLTVYYTYKPSPMVLDADVCPFQDPEAVVAYAYGMLRKSEADPFEDSGNALSEVEERLDEVKSQLNKNNGGLGIKLYNNA